MKKLVSNVILMLAVMNAAIFLGTYISGKPFELNLVFNLVTPIICAVVSWQVDQKRARQL